MQYCSFKIKLSALNCVSLYIVRHNDYNLDFISRDLFTRPLADQFLLQNFLRRNKPFIFIGLEMLRREVNMRTCCLCFSLIVLKTPRKGIALAMLVLMLLLKKRYEVNS